MDKQKSPSMAKWLFTNPWFYGLVVLNILLTYQSIIEDIIIRSPESLIGRGIGAFAFGAIPCAIFYYSRKLLKKSKELE